MEDIVKELPADRHTEDMQEIITKVPSWILRWGIMLFFGILLIIVAISVLVRYPDAIKGTMKIASTGISRPVIATTPGRIVKVLIKTGDAVKKGQLLALVETADNTAYPLIAPQDGNAAFAAIMQPGDFLAANQEVFVIHPLNEQFFGVMGIPQNNISKIKEGQQVLIKLHNYPPEEYGQLKGKITYIASEPLKEGVFLVKVSFIINSSGLKRPIKLESWMTADADIITEDISVESRIAKSIFKGLQ